MIASFRRLKYSWLLLAILALALGIRLATITFGLPALNDPDELMFEMGALRMLRGPTLNPGWFGHPATTTMYLLAVVDALVFLFAHLSGRFATAKDFAVAVYLNPSWIILPGRLVMALIGVATIWLTARLAKRLFGERVGLFAALLLTIDPVHVAWSQVIRSDLMACFFLLLCFQACCNIADRSRWRDYLGAAAWMGLAVATKWPFALAGISIAAAGALAVHSGIASPRTAMTRLLAAALMSVSVLLVTSPFLLIDHATVVQNLHGEAQVHHIGATGGSFSYNLWWYASGSILTAFGIAGLMLVALGAAQLRRHPQALAILIPISIAFILLLGGQRLVWERWVLPLIPIGTILAAAGLAWLIEAMRSMRLPATLRSALVMLVALATFVPLGARVWADGTARTHDTRQLVAAWSLRHIPLGSTIIVEHFAFDMLQHPWTFVFPIADAGCVDVHALLVGRTTYKAIELARAGRSNVDWGTMPTSLQSGCVADFAILTQYDRYRDERTRFPSEYAAYSDLLRRGPVIAVFRPEEGRVAGPVVRVVDLRGYRRSHDR